jgi:hypothetical protein
VENPPIQCFCRIEPHVRCVWCLGVGICHRQLTLVLDISRVSRPSSLAGVSILNTEIQQRGRRGGSTAENASLRLRTPVLLRLLENTWPVPDCIWL